MKLNLPKSKFNNLNSGNFSSIAKEAKEMQKKMEEKLKVLEKKEYSASCGGDAVKCLLNGKIQIISINIDEQLFETKDKIMIEDLVKLCINNAIEKAQNEKNEITNDISGLNLPGLF